MGGVVPPVEAFYLTTMDTKVFSQWTQWLLLRKDFEEPSF